ncbi:hypothetical protein Tco_1484485 [Tanacetum coccineum]
MRAITSSSKKRNDVYIELSKRFTNLEQYCISLEVAMQLNKQIFQQDKTCANQNNPEIQEYFEHNDLKAQLQAKDTVICKLKETIHSLRENANPDKVKKDIDEIETINIELEHNLKTQIQEKVFANAALKNELRKHKGKTVIDTDFEIAFRRHTCFVRNLKGVDLLTGSRGTNLYTLSIGDIMKSSSISNNNNASVKSNHGEVILVKKKGSFIITDDLRITPFFLDRYMELHNSFGVEGNDFLWTYVQFYLNKFVNLLKWSLLTNNPLTTLVNGGSKPSPCSSCIEDVSLDNLPSLFSNSTQPHSTVKILIHKSKKKVLCAEVDNPFVEMFLSFLTIPLGIVKVLTKDTSSLMAINNLCKSISTLGDKNYLKSDDIKNMFLSPKLASIYCHATDLLPLYEKGITQGSFLKEQATFIVSDDLKIELSSFFPTLWLYTHGIPIDDIKIVEVSIGTYNSKSLSYLNLSFNRLPQCILEELKSKINLNVSTHFIADGFGHVIDVVLTFKFEHNVKVDFAFEFFQNALRQSVKAEVEVREAFRICGWAELLKREGKLSNVASSIHDEHRDGLLPPLTTVVKGLFVSNDYLVDSQTEIVNKENEN